MEVPAIDRRKRKVALQEPTAELRLLGEKLQFALESTIDRLGSIRSPVLRRRAIHSIDRAQYMFTSLSKIAQTTDRIAGFMQDHFGLSVDDIFDMMGRNEYAARVSTHSTLVLLNEGIRMTLKDLSIVNADIDKENENGEKKTES